VTKAVYFDTKNNKIVSKEPEEGIVVIAEGEDLTDEARAARLAQYESVQAVAADADAARAKAQDESQVETADAPAAKRTATTASVSGKPKK
jgi:hypothetical protein